MKEYTVVDKQTVKFTLSTPWANFPYMLSYMPGMITSPTAVKAACGPNGETMPRNCKFNLEPIGAGPFKVQKYTPKESIELVRNDTYWGGKPYLDGVTFKVLSGAPATYDVLQTGTLNVGFLREPEIRKKAFDEKKVDFYENFQWMGGVASAQQRQGQLQGRPPRRHVRRQARRGHHPRHAHGGQAHPAGDRLHARHRGDQPAGEQRRRLPGHRDVPEVVEVVVGITDQQPRHREGEGARGGGQEGGQVGRFDPADCNNAPSGRLPPGRRPSRRCSPGSAST